MERAVGAHPGFPDLVGFGRREMKATPREVEDLVAYQIGALAAIAAAQGVRLAAREATRRAVQHGGARRGSRRRDRAGHRRRRSVSRAVRTCRGRSLSRRRSATRLRAVSEAFADRAYRRDGSLVPRNEPGAVIDDEQIVVTRAVAIARERMVIAADGTRVPLDVHTICVHGDTPGAAVLASRIRQSTRRRRESRSGRRRLVSATSTRRRTFPTIVLGSSLRNSTRAGTLYGASRSRQ